MAGHSPEAEPFVIRLSPIRRLGKVIVIMLLTAAVAVGGVALVDLLLPGDLDPFVVGGIFVVLFAVALVVATPVALLLPRAVCAALGPDGVWIPDEPGRRRLTWLPWESVGHIYLRRRLFHWELCVRPAGGLDAPRVAVLWGVDQPAPAIDNAIAQYAGQR